MEKVDSHQKETAATTLNSSAAKELESLQLSDSSLKIATINKAEPISNVYVFLKRIIDVMGSFIGIILLSPLLIFLAIVIKFEDRHAPVFFVQQRIGLDGKPFEMYKFRSMINDAELKLVELLDQNETTGAMFKMANDPRVTKVGKFIRRTSLDELPQLWNVLKGEMSLVGPRPALPREVAKYSSYDLQRLSVLPGCTGLWQVSGRSNIGFNEMVELDLFYIKTRNIKSDIIIILKTFTVLFGSKDAY